MDKFGGRDGSTRERRRLARTEKQVQAISRLVRPEPREAACPAHEVSSLGTGIVEGHTFGQPPSTRFLASSSPAQGERIAIDM